MSLELAVHPNEVSEELTGRDYLSWSAISTYKTCPLRWHFRYVQGLPEETVSSGLVFGGAIHQAVEFHYRELLAGSPAPALKTLLREYQAAWQNRDPATIKYGKDEEVDDLEALAERVLAAFQDSSAAKPAGRILGVEEELRGMIAEGCPDLLARVDLLIDQDDAVVLTDLKTARSRWSQQQARDSGEQLLLYSELVKELMPDKPLRLEFLVITKAKVPVVETLVVALDAARIARTRTIVQRVWQAMRRGIVFPEPVGDELPDLPVPRTVPSMARLT